MDFKLKYLWFALALCASPALATTSVEQVTIDATTHLLVGDCTNLVVANNIATNPVASASITNNLVTTNLLVSTSNTLAAATLAITNGLPTTAITNGMETVTAAGALASTNLLTSTSNTLAAATLAITNSLETITAAGALASTNLLTSTSNTLASATSVVTNGLETITAATALTNNAGTANFGATISPILLAGQLTTQQTFLVEGTAVTPQFQFGGTSAGAASMMFERYSTSVGSVGRLVVGRSATNTLGAYSATTNGNDVGDIYFASTDGQTNALLVCAKIITTVDNTVSSNNIPTAIQFWTYPSSLVTQQLSMSISSSGIVSMPFGATVTNSLPPASSVLTTNFPTTLGIIFTNTVKEWITVSAAMTNTLTGNAVIKLIDLTLPRTNTLEIGGAGAEVTTNGPQPMLIGSNSTFTVTNTSSGSASVGLISIRGDR